MIDGSQLSGVQCSGTILFFSSSSLLRYHDHDRAKSRWGGRLSWFHVVDEELPASAGFLHVMPHSTGPSTPVATITALDEKLTDADATAPTHFLHSHNLTPDNLPYWLVNVPQSQWASECPAFLRDQPPKNIQCLATRDTEYTRQNWDLVQEIVSMWN